MKSASPNQDKPLGKKLRIHMEPDEDDRSYDERFEDETIEPCRFQGGCLNYSPNKYGNCVVDFGDVLECYVSNKKGGYGRGLSSPD